MVKRSSIKTSINEIVDYWITRVDECDLSIDFSEARKRCWRCGCKRNLQRCHIIPHSLGGKDEPSNLVLLCKRCHLDNPNVGDPEIMWDWLKAYKVSFYDTFWNLQGMKEYEKRNITEEDMFEVGQIFQEQFEKASYHFGDPHLNVATLAGIHRMTLKEYDKKHNLKIEKEIKPYITIGDEL